MNIDIDITIQLKVPDGTSQERLEEIAGEFQDLCQEHTALMYDGAPVSASWAYNPYQDKQDAMLDAMTAATLPKSDTKGKTICEGCGHNLYPGEWCPCKRKPEDSLFGDFAKNTTITVPHQGDITESEAEAHTCPQCGAVYFEDEGQYDEHCIKAIETRGKCLVCLTYCPVCKPLVGHNEKFAG